MMDAKARNDCIKEIDLLKVAIHFHYNGIRSELNVSAIRYGMSINHAWFLNEILSSQYIRSIFQ